ncbi:MAG: Uma2 family endonuclease [Gemmatimonadetes bacterium]|nr:Uma2 family endonuclease [Gemmatimonadota bacterium]
MPSLLPHTWTADEVLAIPESPGYRFEAVDGELIVSPSPSLRHQVAVLALSARLLEYSMRHRVGLVVVASFDIVPDPHTVVQPDVLVLPFVDNRPPRSWQEAGRLLLAVEVLSPSTARTDRQLKRRKYQEMGTVSWLVDLDERRVEVWRPGATAPETAAQRLTWGPVSTADPLQIDLASFFAHVDGEEL